MKSGSLNLLEPWGPVQACNGIALPFIYPCGAGTPDVQSCKFIQARWRML